MMMLLCYFQDSDLDFRGGAASGEPFKPPGAASFQPRVSIAAASKSRVSTAASMKCVLSTVFRLLSSGKKYTEALAEAAGSPGTSRRNKQLLDRHR